MLILLLDSISKASVFVALFGILFLITGPICNRIIPEGKIWSFTTGDIIGIALSLAIILNFFTISSPYK